MLEKIRGIADRSCEGEVPREILPMACSPTAGCSEKTRHAISQCFHACTEQARPPAPSSKQPFYDTEARIAACAEIFGFRFYDTPETEMGALHDFWESHLSPRVHGMFVQKVVKVKKIFAREFPKMKSFLEEIQALQNGGTADAPEKIRLEDFRARIEKAAASLSSIGDIDLVASRRQAIFAHLGRMWETGTCRDEDVRQVTQATHILWGVLRYMIEDSMGTYRSGRFSAEYFANVLGFEGIEGLFFREDGERRTVVDLGCGDGDLLKELARVYRTWVRGDELMETLVSSLTRHDVEVILENPNGIDKVHKELFQFLRKIKQNIAYKHEPLDPHLIGVEQTGSAERLCGPDFGISGRTADMCAPWETFQKQSGILPESVDVVTTTLTLDRAYSIENLFTNMATMLRADGRFLIATKGLVKAESDGQGGKESKIQYGGKVLTSSAYAGTLRKLQRELRKHGLEIEAVSCHPVWVISSDCYPSVEVNEGAVMFVPPTECSDLGEGNSPQKKFPKIRPQEYSLMVVTGRKRVG